MLILDDRQFVETSFLNEQEIENIVFQNYELLFGPDAFIIPKAKIKTQDGTGTIPDGFVIDLSNKRWYLVEVELAAHSVWSHIAPQVSKQLIAAQQHASRSLLVELSVTAYREDPEVQAKFVEREIPELDVRRFLQEIFDSPPLVGIPIDKVSTDLKQWAESLKAQVKLWTIKKFTELGNQQSIMFEFPEEFRPDFSTEVDSTESRSIAFYDVSVWDLLENGILTHGAKLTFSYKPRGGQAQTFHSQITEDGSLSMEGTLYESPSSAAIACIQKAGSLRKTENGWRVWKTESGKSLEEIRKELLEKPPRID